MSTPRATTSTAPTSTTATPATATTRKQQERMLEFCRLAGELVAGLTWHNFCDVVEARQLGDDLAPYRQAIAKTAAFVPTLQERDLRHRRIYGGLYGQTLYGVSRKTIHQRSTGYGLIFMLPTLGEKQMAGYNVMGW